MNLFVWVCDDGVDWVVASSYGDAIAVMAEHSGEPTEGLDRGWTALPSDKELRIRQDGWPASGEVLGPTGVRVVIEGAFGCVQWLGEFLVVTEGTIYHVATAGHWAAQNGRGFLCSTEW